VAVDKIIIILRDFVRPMCGNASYFAVHLSKKVLFVKKMHQNAQICASGFGPFGKRPFWFWTFLVPNPVKTKIETVDNIHVLALHLAVQLD